MKKIPPFEQRPPAEFNVPDSTIHLRLFRHGDEDNLVRLVDNEPVQRFVPWAKRVIDKVSAERTIDRFENEWNNGLMARYVIEKDSMFAGYAGLWSDKKPGYYEFGFAVLPEFRKQGIGTNTTNELFDVAKKQLQAKGMVAYVHDDNDASQAVVNKHGFARLDEFDDDDRRYELDF
jgi:RimJ/RimL family protein N-acetyltransferase